MWPLFNPRLKQMSFAILLLVGSILIAELRTTVLFAAVCQLLEEILSLDADMNVKPTMIAAMTRCAHEKLTSAKRLAEMVLAVPSQTVELKPTDLSAVAHRIT